MKKVSIIVPVYNVEKYIRKCLESLVNQTLKDIEVIVVNDGSPDNSQSIIDEYVKKYPHIIKSYIKENGGQGSARNYGYQKATGEYIGFVDSDDYVSLDMYEKLYNKAISNKSDIVICKYTVIDENNNIKEHQYQFNKINNDKIDYLFNNTGVCNKIYKRNLLKSFEFRSKVWYEDIDFIIKVLLKSKKISSIEDELYYYLLREGSTMNNNNIKKNLDILAAFDSILNYILENKEYQKYSDEIEFIAIYHIYITAITRIINIKYTKGKKEIINKLIKYMNEKFPNYKNNKYLYLLNRNKRIIYNLIKYKLYFIVKIIFIVKGIIK